MNGQLTVSGSLQYCDRTADSVPLRLQFRNNAVNIHHGIPLLVIILAFTSFLPSHLRWRTLGLAFDARRRERAEGGGARVSGERHHSTSSLQASQTQKSTLFVLLRYR